MDGPIRVMRYEQVVVEDITPRVLVAVDVG